MMFARFGFVRDNKNASAVDNAARAADVIKILAPLSDNPNAPDNSGITPIQHATEIFMPNQNYMNVEITRILTPCT